MKIFLIFLICATALNSCSTTPIPRFSREVLFYKLDSALREPKNIQYTILPPVATKAAKLSAGVWVGDLITFKGNFKIRFDIDTGRKSSNEITVKFYSIPESNLNIFTKNQTLAIDSILQREEVEEWLAVGFTGGDSVFFSALTWAEESWGSYFRGRCFARYNPDDNHNIKNTDFFISGEFVNWDVGPYGMYGGGTFMVKKIRGL